VFEVTPARILEAGDEILNRRRVAVVTLEIEIHAGAERVAAEDRFDHADQLGAFFIDRRRIEVVDLHIALGPNRVRQRSLVFGELQRLQLPHIGDALNGSRAFVAGELLVAINRQAFLQA